MANPLEFLHGIDVVEVVDANRPIRTVRSSVIGLVGTAGKGTRNEPVLILGSRREAVAAFGRPRNDGFTLPRALDAIFDQVGAMVVVINVQDPADTVDVADEEITLDPTTGALANGFVSDVAIGTTIQAPYVCVAAGTVTLPVGCTLTEIKNLDGDVVLMGTLVLGQKVNITYTVVSVAANTDYTVNAEEGTISRISGGKILPRATLTVDYAHVDPTVPVEGDIIGEVDGAGEQSGLQALLGAKSKVFVQPRILIAPGYTHQKADVVTANPVVSELVIISERLKAIAVIDCPNNTREEAVAHRIDFESERLYYHYPWFKVLAPGSSGTYIMQPPSSRIAGIISRTDNDEGFWFSPSNRTINGISGLSKPVDFSLGDPNCEANYLNSNYVACSIFEGGFRLWGNRTSSGMFLSVRRTADMVEESVQQAHLWAVDRNITRGYFESVVGGVNTYLRQLQAVGAVLGGKAWADRELNTPGVLAEGHGFVDFEFTAPPPAERLTFRAHLVNTYLADVIAPLNE